MVMCSKMRLQFQHECNRHCWATTVGRRDVDLLRLVKSCANVHGSSTMSHVSRNFCLKWCQSCNSRGVEGWKDVRGQVLTVCCE